MQTLRRRPLEQIVDGRTHHHPIPLTAHLEPTNLDPVGAADGLHAGDIPDDLHERLAAVPILIQVADVAGAHGGSQRDGDGVVDPLEPRRDVRDEGDVAAELGGDLALVDVVGEGVRDDVVGEVLDVVFWGGFGARAGVAGHAEDGRGGGDEGHEWGDPDLGGGGVAARVGDAFGGGDPGAVDQFGEAVGPAGVEAVVGAEVDDEAVGFGLVDGVDPWFGDAVGEGHHPDVDVASLGHAPDIVVTEVVVGYLSLAIPFELLSSKLAAGYVSKIGVRM